MSDDYSPDEAPWRPEGVSDEELEKILADEEGPRRHAKKAVEETLKRLERRFGQIVTDLEPHGIDMFRTVWDCNPSQWNLSACDPGSAELAELMFELGCIVADYSHLDNRLQELDRGVVRKGAIGAETRRAQGDETTRRIRTAFAELLENDEDAVDLDVSKIAKRLHEQLESAGPGNSVPTIRRELSKFREEILARAAELEILGPYNGPLNVSKIRRVAGDGEGKPGVSFRTVQFFLT